MTRHYREPTISDKTKAKAKALVESHLFGNLTTLVTDLMHRNDEEALLLWGGEDDYEAHEVWAVPDWLAGRLRSKDYRVPRWKSQNLWARGTTGQAIYLDDVIQEIAEDEIKLENRRATRRKA